MTESVEILTYQHGAAGPPRGHFWSFTAMRRDRRNCKSWEVISNSPGEFAALGGVDWVVPVSAVNPIVASKARKTSCPLAFMRPMTSATRSDSATAWLMASPNSFMSFLSCSFTAPSNNRSRCFAVSTTVASLLAVEYAFDAHVCIRREQIRGFIKLWPARPGGAAHRGPQDRREPLGTGLL